MQTYGFDGTDIDWEYPGASDRGGVAADTANFVSLCREMQIAFGSRYGLTVTLPTSYWYLQHFDINSMQQYVSWFNVMAYDLHGTWDSPNVYEGPYIRPHTNLTEIDQGMQLLWRAGVSPSKVVMGMGWYGRSFTLSSSSCNQPNGVCQFSSGGNAGPCSTASGILMNSEIQQIIGRYNLQVSTDTLAAVNWITWNSNQWVSYDNNVTYQLKRNYANSLGLSGTMIWAIDQQTQDATGLANFMPFNVNLSPDEQSASALTTSNVQAQDACYITACGDTCLPGYIPLTAMNGTTTSILSTEPRCSAALFRSLCCGQGTSTDMCQWRGWRGQGLSCVGGCLTNETTVAQSSNSYLDLKEQNYVRDLSCNGGVQSFCCSNFKPVSARFGMKAVGMITSPKPGSVVVTGSTGVTGSIWAAAISLCTLAVTAFLAPLEAIEAAIPIVGWIADLIEIAATPLIIRTCAGGIIAAGVAQVEWGKHTTTIMSPTTGGPIATITPGQKVSNPYSKVTYGKGTTTCQVTYTCLYGRGFDEVN